MSQSAYALKESAELDQVGSVFVNDSLSMNIRQALEDGDGYLVTDDQAAIKVLDGYEPLKRVSVSEVHDAQQKKAGQKAEKPAAGKAAESKESRS